jgi:hypothetical protein
MRCLAAAEYSVLLLLAATTRDSQLRAKRTLGALHGVPEYAVETSSFECDL